MSIATDKKIANLNIADIDIYIYIYIYIYETRPSPKHSPVNQNLSWRGKPSLVHKCPGYHIKFHLIVIGALGNVEYFSLPLLPGPLSWSGITIYWSNQTV